MFTIGIDLGGTNISVGLCDESLNIIDTKKTKTHAERTPDEITADMASLAIRIMEENSLSANEIEYVGIASPGVVDSQKGTVEKCCNLPFRSYPLAAKLSELLPVKRTLLANDANAAALAEALVGAARGTKNSVMITLGTGVGSGIIIDGRIFSGGLNSAGAELGHMVIKTDGRQCACGRRGCLECYCSAIGLANMTKEKMRELEMKEIDSLLFDIAKKDGKIGARTPFKAMKAGDQYGKAIVDKYVKYLGIGLANVVNIFQPEVISVGGGVCNEGDYLIEPLKRIVDTEQFTRDSAVRTRVTVAKLGTMAGIVGAAGLGRQL